MPPVTPIPQTALDQLKADDNQDYQEELSLTEVAKFGAVVKIDQRKSLLFDEDATEKTEWQVKQQTEEK